MAIPPYMFTQYPAPGGAPASLLLGAGQLREQKRAAVSREQFQRDQAEAAEKRRIEAIQGEIIKGMYKAAEENRYSDMAMLADFGKAYGLNVQVGGKPTGMPTDAQTGGLPMSPGQIGRQAAAPETPSAQQEPEEDTGPSVAELEARPDTTDYYEQEVAEPQRKAEAIKNQPKGKQAVGVGAVEKAMAAGDEKALDKMYGGPGVAAAQSVELDETPTIENPEQQLEQMRAAQKRGEGIQQGRQALNEEVGREIAQLVSQAGQLMAKSPEKAAELLGQANELRPHPGLKYQQGEALEKAGLHQEAVVAYLGAAAMDPAEAPPGDELWAQGVSMSRQRVAAMGPPMQSPAQITAPVDPSLLKQGWSISGFRGSEVPFRFTQEQMKKSQHMKFDGLWTPIIESAYHPVLKEMATAASDHGHRMIDMGWSPSKALAESQEMYNKRADRWARIEAANRVAASKAQSRGDNLDDERWKRKERFVKDFKIRHKVGQVGQEITRLQTLLRRVDSAGAKERAAIWGQVIKEIEGGRATDEDVNRVVGAGSLMERAKHILAKSGGTPTEQEMAELHSILSGMIGMNQTYLINSAQNSYKLFSRDPSNVALYGRDGLSIAAATMLPDMSAGEITMDIPGAPGIAPPPQKTRESSSSSFSVSSSGPIGKKTSADLERDLGGL